MIAVAFDIGGTFTDFVLHDSATGHTQALKVATTPIDPSIAVIEGLENILAQSGISAENVGSMLHATTIATNAVLERKGAPTGLITTAGFRDVLIIGRQKRYETYDLYISKPKPLVQRRYITEVQERVAADGTVVNALDMESVDRAIDAIVGTGRETVAVSLLHAYANSTHERSIRDRISKRAPELSVSISSEVSPKFREYERTNTTVTNAYVRPVVDRYIGHLEAALQEQGFRDDLLIMQSNGGLVSPAIARDFPIRIIESGPAAGILMCSEVGRAAGFSEILTFDMGGTTAKLGAIDGGTPAIMPTLEVDLVRHRRGSGLPINVPAIEMLEIGAGGGSIARVDRGMIAVGPDSAGADPGPICYGRGGTQPTITDANVVLGYISPDGFNAGAMQLDKSAAIDGVTRHVAEPLGLEVEAAAWGVHLIATSNMQNALRLVSIERGRDPRKYAMVAFGGAGPLHAARLARAVGIPTVLVPHGAGVGSAIGLLQAEPRLDVTATRVLRLDQTGALESIASVYRALEEQARKEIERVSTGAEVSWSRYAEMRYAGQGFEIRVALPDGSIGEGYIDEVAAAFDAAYRQRNKFLDTEGVVEGVDWSLVARLPSEPVGSIQPEAAEKKAARRESVRQCWFPETNGFVETRILQRSDLTEGVIVPGPAIVEDQDCTTVVPPGDSARLNSGGHLMIEIDKETGK
ncbi:MAG: hydantoinase/oxoprolinase family protein [Pseudomonadota bacterium]